jgi:hypothetical protein
VAHSIAALAWLRVQAPVLCVVCTVCVCVGGGGSVCTSVSVSTAEHTGRQCCYAAMLLLLRLLHFALYLIFSAIFVPCVVLCCVLCRLPDGSHCGLQEATEWPRPKCADVMWDWWLAETLKVRFCAENSLYHFLLLLQQHQLLLLILCAAQSVPRGAGTQHAHPRSIRGCFTPSLMFWI